ncbi:MAG: SDR family oxidoreductase [Candidatus Abawacabacteria bacterium]|nr:SDR family oxidoreductase [Candidatus Abawacabacteria bacterium]
MPIALITGSSSGIGKVTAKLFQAKGWQVIATMRSPEKEEELKQVSNVEIKKLDVTNSTQIEQTVAEIVDKYQRVDVLINNAGYGLIGPFESATNSEIEQQFQTNVFGLMHMCRAVLPAMRRQKNGTIINISSMLGKIALPFHSLYTASKFAVEGFSEALQYEIKQFGIRIKLVEPGSTSTDFFSRSLITTDIHKVPEYKILYEQLMKNSESWNDADPSIVAQVIYQAATDNKQKLRYPVGKDSKRLLRLRHFIPEQLWHYLMDKFLLH